MQPIELKNQIRIIRLIKRHERLVTPKYQALSLQKMDTNQLLHQLELTQWPNVFSYWTQLIDDFCVELRCENKLHTWSSSIDLKTTQLYAYFLQLLLSIQAKDSVVALKLQLRASQMQEQNMTLETWIQQIAISLLDEMETVYDQFYS